MISTVGAFAGLLLGQRQGKRHTGSLSHGAIDGDITAKIAHQFTDLIAANTETTPLGGLERPEEFFVHELLRHARALIGDRDKNCVLIRHCIDLDSRARWTRLQGIGNNMFKHAVQNTEIRLY
jgi:hypothetical protein